MGFTDLLLSMDDLTSKGIVVNSGNFQFTLNFVPLRSCRSRGMILDFIRSTENSSFTLAPSRPNHSDSQIRFYALTLGVPHIELFASGLCMESLGSRWSEQ